MKQTPHPSILAKRLKQFRLARGLSIDELVAKSGGVVTKQAISKYELGKINPSPRVITKLAESLGIKSVALYSEPNVQVEFIAYRKGSALPKKEQNRIESLVKVALESHVKLKELTSKDSSEDLPIKEFSVSCFEDTEEAASRLRSKWKLGNDPISNVVDTLEDHSFHVLELEAHTKFDGISAIAYTENTDKPTAAAVIVRRGVVGERQRLDLSHELGHVVLKIDSGIDEERAAFRFGAAFLAPRDLMVKEVGEKRSNIRFDELLMLKQRFGMSIQAILFRLKDIGVINKAYYTEWFKLLSRVGYRKQEPNQLPPEKPIWLRQTVLRAYAEDLITHEEAEALLNETIKNDVSLKQVKLRSFMKLPLADRHRILEEQAASVANYYNSNSEWKDLGAGDFANY